MPTRLLLTGSIALDRIMVYPGKFADIIQPDKLHVLSISVLLDDLQETPGGIAANIAYTLALLGKSPILYGSVGKNSTSYMRSLRTKGVDISHLHWSAKPTASFSVITDTAHCQVGGFYPGAMGDASALTIESFKDEDVLVVISAHDPSQMAMQVAECVKFGKPLFYDVGQQAINIPAADIRAGIEAATILIVNDYEMGILVEKTGWSQAEIQQKVSIVVVTLGANGATLCMNGSQYHVDAVPDLTVVDPTGAGDAFRAGFLSGYVDRLDSRICIQLGSVAASFAVEQAGTQTHRFSKRQFAKRYQTTYKEAVPRT